MARETPHTPASERRPGAQRVPHGQPGEERSDERMGPVVIERLRKADGRALILYRRAREPQQ